MASPSAGVGEERGDHSQAVAEVVFSPLHRAVFNGDLPLTRQLLASDSGSAKRPDKYGNTPLHLSVMLGHTEITLALLDHGAEVKEKNRLGWTALDEAISYGNTQTITLLLKTLRNQISSSLMRRREELISSLRNLGDFYAELKWEFHTWVPFLSRLLPSDVCKIRKTGCSIRLDSTLGDFSEMKWTRGDLSFIYCGENGMGAEPMSADPAHSFSILVLDNESKEYQHMKLMRAEAEEGGDLDKHIRVMMKRPIVYANMSTQPITVKRAQAGWFYKYDKTESVGQYADTMVYDVDKLILITRKRREHLTPEQVSEEENMRRKFRNGEISEESLAKMQKSLDEDETDGLPPSLTPPSCQRITWEQYISSSIDEGPIHLGRPMDLKIEKRPFKASVCMAGECPIELAKLLDVLEVIVPYKHFHKLREFVSLKLPPGFPVKLDVPVFPTVTATVTLEKFKHKIFEPSIFKLPDGYKKFVPKKESESSSSDSKKSKSNSKQ